MRHCLAITAATLGLCAAFATADSTIYIDGDLEMNGETLILDSKALVFESPTAAINGQGEIVLAPASGDWGTIRMADTLAIQEDILVRTVQGGGGLYSSGGGDRMGLVENYGTISADAPGETLQIGSDNYLCDLENHGTLRVKPGSLMEFRQSLANYGTISVDDGTMVVWGDWSNPGQATVSGGSLELIGPVAGTDLQRVTCSNGGQIILAGPVDNAGNVLDLDAHPILLRPNCVITGGTLRSSTEVILNLDSDYDRVHREYSGLDDVRLEADVLGSDRMKLGSLEFASGHTLTLDGADTEYSGSGPVTLSGQGVLAFGENWSEVDYEDAHLTIGENVTVRPSPGDGGMIRAREIINRGKLISETGTRCTILSEKGMRNEGQIEVRNLSNFYGTMQGSIGDILIDEGHVVQLSGDFIVDTPIDATGHWLRLGGSDYDEWEWAAPIRTTNMIVEIKGKPKLTDMTGSYFKWSKFRWHTNRDFQGETLDIRPYGGWWQIAGETEWSNGAIIAGGGQLQTHAGMIRPAYFTNMGIQGEMSIKEDNHLRVNQRLTLIGGAELHLEKSSLLTMNGISELEGKGTVWLSADGGADISGNRYSADSVLKTGVDINVIAIGPNSSVGRYAQTLVNKGRLEARGESAELLVTAETAVENRGTLAATNGGSLTVTSLSGDAGDLQVGAGSSMSLDGTYTVGGLTLVPGDGELSLGGTWSATGTTSLTGGTVVLRTMPQTPENFRVDGANVALNMSLTTTEEVSNLIHSAGDLILDEDSHLDNSGDRIVLGEKFTRLIIDGGRLTGGELTNANGSGIEVRGQGAIAYKNRGTGYMENVDVDAPIHVLPEARLEATGVTTRHSLQATGANVVLRDWTNYGHVVIERGELELQGSVSQQGSLSLQNCNVVLNDTSALTVQDLVLGQSIERLTMVRNAILVQNQGSASIAELMMANARSKQPETVVRFEIHGGEMVVDDLAAGGSNYDYVQFLQTGGVLEVTGEMDLGDDTTYLLAGGILRANSTNLGHQKIGTVIRQTGGLAEISAFRLGYSGTGTYLMEGGELHVGWGFVGNYRGNATFTQTGATVTVDGSWSLAGDRRCREAIYNLSGGNFSAAEFRVGYREAGTMNQSGGRVEAPLLYVGKNDTADGTYNFSGGEIIAGQLLFGEGAGLFDQTGGTVSADVLTLGDDEADQAYRICEGILQAGDVTLQDYALLEIIGSGADISAASMVVTSQAEIASTIDSQGLTTIDVTGTVTLDGILRITDDGARFGRFDVIVADGGITGMFDEVILPEGDWNWGSNGSTVYVQHVPEPFALFTLGIGGLALLKRKKTQ